MCGVVGFWAPSGVNPGQAQRLGEGMARRIAHRGPDDSGVWVDGDAGVVLAHRRLSIVDLSAAGAQPMVSASGRYVLVYNGEVYNGPELRESLEPLGGGAGESVGWRGHSDTEALLATMDRFGVVQACRRANGMFAFAVWDRETRTLSLARDRVGIKPLYFTAEGRTGDGAGPVVLFGSELKAMATHPGFRFGIDRDALSAFFFYGYVPAPQSIYQGVYKVMPGEVVTVGFSGSFEISKQVYWSGKEVAKRGVAQPFQGDRAEAAARLESLLLESVQRRLVADVPVGAFLSGGVDSSVVTALMQKVTGGTGRTFSIGYASGDYDESQDAQRVAAHLGTRHETLRVTPEEAQDVVPRLGEMYDEPFADSSQIPTHLVSALARQHVTVALSGDGGDELFGGYNRHTWGPRLWKRLGQVPVGLRSMAAGAMGRVPPGAWEWLLRVGAPLFPDARLPLDKLRKVQRILDAPDYDTLYARLCAQWQDPSRLVCDARPMEVLRTEDVVHPAQRMMLADLLGYLPGDILTKVDRASMAVSLEVRVPLLDHALVEFAWSLPPSMTVGEGPNASGKEVLRDVLYKYVPRALIDRPKMGFGVPVGEWICGPMRDWAEALLDPKSLEDQGLESAPVTQCWNEHLSGTQDHTAELWCVLMFRQWVQSSEDRLDQV